MLALDAIAFVADAAYKGKKAGQRRHDSEEDNREDVAILAELLVLDLLELVGGALEPSPHARDALVILHAVGFQAGFAYSTCVRVHLIDVLVRADWH